MRKTKADTASYVDRFNENVRKNEAEAVAELKATMDELNSIYEQKNTEILSIRDDISRTANIEDHALYRAQLQIFRNAERLMGLTDPLLGMIDFALKTSLKLGEDWPQNVKDAVTIISMAKEDVQKTITKQLSSDTKVNSESLGWGQAVKITNRSMRSVLRHLPTTEADLI
ncbi:hypothetical protein EX30DRAFT_342125 [Ascodesmis nigricans]|uniref:Uncharacterized protein n=1 Tax=Ascodesmis nigricans TaxID=341454 RepID=A0A4S2MTH6_9PEZI|nr:hypothetical protein EX30DRAFT_342125 [Ascodesmis nigricans]